MGEIVKLCMTTVERGIAKEMMRTHDEPLHPPAEQLCVNLLFSASTFLKCTLLIYLLYNYTNLT